MDRAAVSADWPRCFPIAAAVYTALVSALLAHGIPAIATAPNQTPLPHGIVEPVKSRQTAPRLGLGMTFVDVGQRSAPGLGVVDRF